MKASNFSLPDQNGKLHSLTDYKGKWLIIYFYPKDDTPSCTKEACGFRDNLSEFKKHGVAVKGDIVKKYERVNLKTHTEETLADISSLVYSM